MVRARRFSQYCFFCYNHCQVKIYLNDAVADVRCQKTEVAGRGELLDFFCQASGNAKRADTSATGRGHSLSSRSHVIYCVEVISGDSKGVLMVVDLAGSENFTSHDDVR